MRPSYRVLAGTATLSLLLSVASLGLLIWVLNDQPYWLAGAYSVNKGPIGDQGPRGPVGPVGPEGPVGPDAQSAVDDLSSQLDDLEIGSGDQASSSVDDLASELDDVQSSVDEVKATVDNICSEFAGYSGALGDIYLSAC
jgi:hypothetical protein